jgi:hypothetical protein
MTTYLFPVRPSVAVNNPIQATEGDDATRRRLLAPRSEELDRHET